MKKIFISGITGQDGAWLAKLHIEKGSMVYGGVRDKNNITNWRLKHLGIQDSIHFVDFNLLSSTSIEKCIKEILPDEFYNLAAQSSVVESFKNPIETSHVDGISILYILEAIKNFSPQTRLFQASSSEMFGNAKEIPQTENTTFLPSNPYAVAKSFAHWMVINYRNSFGLYCVNGILYSHESELRSENFLSRKVSLHVANWYHGNKNILEVGNLDTEKDWGYAKEFVQGIYSSLQAEKPDDYIFATGIKTKVRNFIEHAFSVINVSLRWEGENENQLAYDTNSGELLVQINPKFYRPIEIKSSYGDASKAKKYLNWTPSLDFKNISEIMVRCDIDRLKNEKFNK